MNKQRRKALSDLIERIQDEEEECRDNIPESLQGSERYEQAESACEALEEAFYSIDEAIDYINSAIEA